MIVLKSILAGAVCFGILCVGLRLTVRSYTDQEGDALAIRLLAPPVIFSMLLFFYCVYGIYSLFDSNPPRVDIGYWGVFSSIFALGILYSVKNLVAPLVLAVLLSWLVYNGICHGQWELIPIYRTLAEGLLDWTFRWVQIGYIWVSILCLIASTVSAIR